jgi:hypothetical protein
MNDNINTDRIIAESIKDNINMERNNSRVNE